MAVEPGLRTTPNVRVNLLPPEIEERRQAQRVQVVAAAVVAAAAVIVALLYVVAAHSLSTAKKDLATAQAQQVELTARKNALLSVDQLHAALDGREQQLTTAMGQEVLFSTYLNTLQRTLPDRIWIDTFTASITIDGSPGANVLAPTAIGTVSITGHTLSANQDDIAVFLETLAKPKGYTAPYFSLAAQSDLSKSSPPFIFDFITTVQLTPDARSGRYTSPGGPHQ